MIGADAHERDTDADWRRIGEAQPYWGVSSNAQYRTENLTPAAIQEFYASGRIQVAALAADLERLTGKAVHVGRALDFGCGVGRLSEALTGHAQEVIGYDVSPGMLEIARTRGSRVRYTDVLPDPPLDWINAYIVFQHIPPAPGLARLDDLLRRLAPDGLVSLHFTIWRDEALRRRPPAWRARLRRPKAPLGSIEMYDYDLAAIFRVLEMRDIVRTMLVATDHGGHHGVMIFGQRGRPAAPSY